MLVTAAANPHRLVVGIDPVTAAMAEASRRAGAAPRKGGLPNALFVVASAEALPAELASLADAVTVNLPWGSLLRGALALDEAAARGIASMVAPGGRVSMLLAPAERDRLAADVSVEARLDGSLAADWASLGLALSDARPATREDLAAAGTTWARRLFAGGGGAAAGRRAWRLELSRCHPPEGAGEPRPTPTDAEAANEHAHASVTTRAVILAPCSEATARTASMPRGSSSSTTTRTSS